MVQIDVCAEEMGNNVPSAVRLLGDAKAVAGQLAERVASSGWSYPAKTAWWDALHTKVRRRPCPPPRPPTPTVPYAHDTGTHAVCAPPHCAQMADNARIVNKMMDDDTVPMS